MKKLALITLLCTSGLMFSCKKEQRDQPTAYSEKNTIMNKKDIGQAD